MRHAEDEDIPTTCVSQRLMFDFSARRRESITYPIKHSQHQETPIPDAYEDTQP